MAVIGDKSGSVSVTIRTSNIIASLVTTVSNADLVFFDRINGIPSIIHKDVERVKTFQYIEQICPKHVLLI